MTFNDSIGTNQPLKEASAALGSIASDLRATATKKVHETVGEIQAQANDAKDNVAGEVKNVANALRLAADELRGGSAQERTIGQIASTLSDASDALRNKDLGQILQMANQVARNNPILFIGGAALLGLAASRFAKASSYSAERQIDESFGMEPLMSESEFSERTQL